jgi:hypothetical protein
MLFHRPVPFFSRKRRRRDRLVDVIALSPIGVRAIDALRAVASRHELSHTAVAKKAKATAGRITRCQRGYRHAGKGAHAGYGRRWFETLKAAVEVIPNPLEGSVRKEPIR